MAGPLATNPFAHLAATFFTARSDPQVTAVPGGPMMYVWQSIYSDFQNSGTPLPPNAFQAVNQLWKWSSEVVNADNVLSKGLRTLDATGRDQAIDASFIGDSLGARALEDRPEGPQFSVVYRTVYSVDGEPFVDTFQHDFGYALPQTLGALNDALDEAAALQVSDYGYEYEGVATPISIRAY